MCAKGCCLTELLFLCSVEAIYPVHDPTALRDAKVKSLIQYAMKVGFNYRVIPLLAHLCNGHICDKNGFLDFHFTG